MFDKLGTDESVRRRRQGILFNRSIKTPQADDHLEQAHSRAFQAATVCVAVLFTTTLMLTGCSKVDHGERVPLIGSISVNGLPLDVKATIYFDPIEGQQGIGAAGEVKDSMFEIPPESGLTPGRSYNVKVITVPGIPAEGTPLDEIKQPQTYTTTVEVPPADGKEPIDLSIDIVSEDPAHKS